MPMYAEMHDGTRLEFPDGTNPDVVQRTVKNVLMQRNAETTATPISKAERFWQGLKDPVEGGAQLLTHALPDGVVKAGSRANNWLADKGLPVARIPEGGMDELVQQNETTYQARRRASEPKNVTSLVTGKAPEPGVDWMRMAGNVASPVSIALGGVGSAATLPGRIALGAATGATSNALNPVISGDYWSSKGKQVATGAAFGGGASAIGSGLARVVSPKASTNPAVQKLMDEGITPTPGQISGGVAKRTEEGLASVPIVGTFIRNAQGRAAEDLNRAAANRALKPVGAKLPEGVTGSDAVEFVQNELGKQYDAILPKLTVQTDKQFAGELAKLSQMVKSGSIDPKYANAFDRFMRDNVISKFKGRNAITGQTMKDIESDLGQKAARLAQSQDPDARLMADALKEVQSNLRGLVERSNPQSADALKAVNTGYANFKRLQRASSSVAAEDGMFNAAQLHSAVKALDKSKDKAAFARGDALMQDLSAPAKKVLGGRLPDSGTTERALTVGMFLDPRAYATALAAPVLYSQPGQKLLAGLLAKRPDGAEAVAQSLREAAPRLGLLGGQMGLGLLNN